MGTEPMGRGRRHSTMDAELPGDVIGRRYDAPLLWRTADDHRMADQFRSVPFLYRGVEGVHIAVQNHRQSGSNPRVLTRPIIAHRTAQSRPNARSFNHEEPT